MSSSKFDNNCSRFKICCLHVTTASLIIGIIEIVATIINFLYSTSRFIQNIHTDASTIFFVVAMVFGCIQIICASMLIYGVKKEVREFLIVHMAFQIALILLLCACVLTFITALAGACDYVRSEFDTGVLIFLLVIFCVYAWLHAWFISVVYQTFVNLREKSQYRKNLTFRQSVRRGKIVSPDIFFTENSIPIDTVTADVVDMEATIRPIYPTSFMTTFTLDRTATVKSFKQPMSTPTSNTTKETTESTSKLSES